MATRWVSRPNEHRSSIGYNCCVAPVLVLMARDRDTAGKCNPQYHNYDA